MNHKELHRGQTRCPVCSRVFSTKNALKKHVESVHSRTGEPSGREQPPSAVSRDGKTPGRELNWWLQDGRRVWLQQGAAERLAAGEPDNTKREPRERDSASPSPPPG